MISYTTRARIALALTPVWLPLAITWNVFVALLWGAVNIAKTVWEVNYDLVVLGWYRMVWRVARYGSVLDQ